MESVADNNTVDAVIGTGLNFDGNNDLITVPHDDDFQTAPLTMSCWFSAGTLPSVKGESEYLIRKATTGTPYHVYLLYLYQNWDKLVFYCRESDGTTRNFLYGDSVISVDTWHHVAITIASNGDMNLYVDGELEDNGSTADIYDGDYNLYIGANNSSTRLLDGQMDNVVLLNEVLDANEVRTLYYTGQIEYDDGGNLTTDREGYAYEYDYENRISKIKRGTTDIAEYSYDALGRRVEKIDSITSTNSRRYYYDKDWRVLDEYNTTGSVKRSYLYGNYIDEVLFTWYGPSFIWRYYVHDHLYSPVALLDTSGAVQERYEYDAYGEPNILDADYSPDDNQLPDSLINSYLFTGRRLDILDTGSLKIQYNRNRYYDYYTGRWTTQDPLGITPNPQKPNSFVPLRQYADGFNAYLYVRNNPSRYVDLHGLRHRCGECSPPEPPRRNAYRPEIVEWGTSSGLGNPSVSPGLNAAIAIIDTLGSLSSILNGPLDCLDALTDSVSTDIALAGCSFIESNLRYSDMRGGWFMWAHVEYETCQPCNIFCKATRPWIWRCRTYHFKKANKWHWCDPETDDSMIHQNVSGYDRDMQFRTAKRNCWNSAMTQPDKPASPNGDGLPLGDVGF